MSQPFLSAMFDYDGTITAKRGIHTIEPELEKLLIGLTQNHTFALCSGRRFPFIKPVIDDLCAKSPNPSTTRENWYLVCENGSTGYYYDPLISDYQEHYHIPWPYGDDHKLHLYKAILERLQDMIESNEVNRSVIVIRPKNYQKITSQELWQKSEKLLHALIPIIEEFDPKNHIHAFNSALAVIIINTAADKDEGIHNFAEFLKTNRNLDPGPRAEKILTIGDSPQPGGNDEAFLSGKYGTPFTVGELNPDNPHLKAVMETNGKPLRAAAGTKQILEKYFQAH